MKIETWTCGSATISEQFCESKWKLTLQNPPCSWQKASKEQLKESCSRWRGWNIIQKNNECCCQYATVKTWHTSIIMPSIGRMQVPFRNVSFGPQGVEDRLPSVDRRSLLSHSSQRRPDEDFKSSIRRVNRWWYESHGCPLLDPLERLKKSTGLHPGVITLCKMY